MAAWDPGGSKERVESSLQPIFYEQTRTATRCTVCIPRLRAPRPATISRHQAVVWGVVIFFLLVKSAVDASHDTQPGEHSNHMLKVQPCLKGKGHLQTLPPSLCSRPDMRLGRALVVSWDDGKR